MTTEDDAAIAAYNAVIRGTPEEKLYRETRSGIPTEIND